ncbi:hypothetical protein [Brevibacillus borstelensis]|uniref:hypothetical protein n=1 Tax=Brevibacillus borstelensis TaxID=45462 RepID=UPI0030BDCFB2
MKKSTRLIVSMFVVAAIAGGSFGVFYSDANASKKQIEESDKMKKHRSKETNDKIEKSWKSAKETFEFDDSDWTKYDYADRSHFTKTLSEQEKSSFYEAMLNAMSEHQKVGDMMPILMVNKDKTKAVIMFKRDEGKGKSVKIELALEGDSKASISAESDKETREWKVDSVEEK